MQNDKQTLNLAQQRKGRLVLILMLTFFVVPLVVVMMMYKFNWMPHSESMGDLVRPARLLNSEPALQEANGQALPGDFWKTRWSIVYVADDCQAACLAKLHDMRQLHASLYKDMPRAQRVLITRTQDIAAIKRDYPDLIVLNQPAEHLAPFTAQFKVAEEDVATSNRLYLVDPLGHFMMSYSSDMPLATVRKDVARLLRFSWAG
jgi:cytochrome oxidase Cu insertion factor (SCO1/SenC/PrrC family)